MDIKKKRYYIVFTGLFLVILGMLIYALRPVKKIKKESNVLTKVSAVKTVKVVKAEKAKGLPLNFVYDVPSDYKRTIPHYVGMKRHIEDMDNMQIVCNGKNCKRQVLTTSKVKVYHTKKAKKTLSVVNGNVVFSKNNLKYLKSDVKIIGDLYIKDINFLKIPDNFSISLKSDTKSLYLFIVSFLLILLYRFYKFNKACVAFGGILIYSAVFENFAENLSDFFFLFICKVIFCCKTGRQNSKAHSLYKSDVFLLDMMIFCVWVENSQRVLVGCAVVAQYKVKLKLTITHTRNWCYGVVRSICVCENFVFFVTVCSPGIQYF